MDTLSSLTLPLASRIGADDFLVVVDQGEVHADIGFEYFIRAIHRVDNLAERALDRPAEAGDIVAIRGDRQAEVIAHAAAVTRHGHADGKRGFRFCSRNG